MIAVRQPAPHYSMPESYVSGDSPVFPLQAAEECVNPLPKEADDSSSSNSTASAGSDSDLSHGREKSNSSHDDDSDNDLDDDWGDGGEGRESPVWENDANLRPGASKAKGGESVAHTEDAREGTGRRERGSSEELKKTKSEEIRRRQNSLESGVTDILEERLAHYMVSGVASPEVLAFVRCELGASRPCRVLCRATDLRKTLHQVQVHDQHSRGTLYPPNLALATSA